MNYLLHPFVARRWPTERDPHNHQVQWRLADGQLEFRRNHTGWWTKRQQPSALYWIPTPERVAVWVALQLLGAK